MSGDLHSSIALGVNIYHVATLRQARRARYPDPLHAALLAEEAGADSITLHLREDRRHIQDRDVTLMREALQTRMNLEMAVTDEMVRIALKVLPQDCCLVPNRARKSPPRAGCPGSRCGSPMPEALGRGHPRLLFIDPDPAQIEATQRAGAR
jgi:pyridoxine 5-phosphate synthase